MMDILFSSPDNTEQNIIAELANKFKVRTIKYIFGFFGDMAYGIKPGSNEEKVNMFHCVIWNEQLPF